MRMKNEIQDMLLDVMTENCVNIVEIFSVSINNPFEEIQMVLEIVFPKTVVNEIIGCGIESPCALIINMRVADVACTPAEFIFFYDLPDLI